MQCFSTIRSRATGSEGFKQLIHTDHTVERFEEGVEGQLFLGKLWQNASLTPTPPNKIANTATCASEFFELGRGFVDVEGGHSTDTLQLSSVLRGDVR